MTNRPQRSGRKRDLVGMTPNQMVAQEFDGGVPGLVVNDFRDGGARKHQKGRQRLIVGLIR